MKLERFCNRLEINVEERKQWLFLKWSRATFSLLLAQKHDLHSIAFPCISTGVYRFPAEAAARIALESLKQSLPQCPAVEKIIFCCFSKTDAEYYRALLAAEQAV